jgi:hypothetical protein
MGLLSDFTGYSKAEFSKEDVEDIYDKNEKTDNITAPAYEEIKYRRIPKKNLDMAYINDAQTFGTINRKVHKILRAQHKIIADKKGDQEKWDAFFDNIGKIGQKIDAEELHERNFFDKFKFGTPYIEFIFNDNYDKIVDLKPLDARALDYARDSEDNIVFNKDTQRPLGFTIKIDNNKKSIYPGDKIPDGYNVKIDSNKMFIMAFRIAVLPLFSFGNGWEYSGIIEPSYLSKTRKDKIVEAITNELYIAGSNPIYGVLGDSNRRPSKQQKKKTLEAIQNLRHSSATVFEHPTEIKTLDVKHSDQYSEIIKFLKADQSNGFGVPLALMDNTADIPRSALNQMRSDMDLSDQAIVQQYVRQFNKQILDFIAAVNGWSKSKLVWGDVSSEDIETKVKNLTDMVRYGVIRPEDALSEISKAMNITDAKAPDKIQQNIENKNINDEKADKTDKDTTNE